MAKPIFFLKRGAFGFGKDIHDHSTDEPKAKRTRGTPGGKPKVPKVIAGKFNKFDDPNECDSSDDEKSGIEASSEALPGKGSKSSSGSSSGSDLEPVDGTNAALT